MLRFVLIFLLPVALTGPPAPCPSLCACKGDKVDCSKRGLSSIPSDIPSSAVSIDLSQNNIASVPNKAFATAPNLETVDLRHNAISSLGDSAFDDLKYLKSLFLISNRLDDQTVWTSVSSRPQLRQLYLSHNLFTKIPPIQSPTIYSLVLDGNQISSIVFPAEIALCAALQSIVLSGNNIQAIGSADLKNLASLNIKSLDLKLNSLVQIDPKAFEPIASFLETLNIDHNRLPADMIKNILTGLASAHKVALLTFSLGYNSLTTLDKDFLAPLSAGTLRNIQLDGMAFTSIDPAVLAPVNKSLELLSFKDCGFTKPPLDFTTLSNLQDLRLDKNRLTTIPPLPKSLQRLTASQNSIVGWPASALSQLTDLRGLNLALNAIQNVSNKPDQPNSLAGPLTSLQVLNLQSNPFNCSCKLMWFVTWAAQHPKVVTQFAKKYTCASPPNLAGKPVKDLKVTPCLGGYFQSPAVVSPPRIIVVVRGVNAGEVVCLVGMLLLFFLCVLTLRQTARRRVEVLQDSEKQRLFA